MQKDDVTFENVIHGVRRQLLDNGVRIAKAPHFFNHVWWPIREPDISTQLMSDYGVSSGPNEITEQFHAEVKAIHECLDKLEHSPRFAEWQKTKDPNASRMYASMNQRAEALNIWEQIAFPLRLRGDVLFRIFAPRDVLGGTPIIDAMRVDEFIQGVSIQTIHNKQELARLQKQLSRWRAIACVTGIVLIAFLAFGLHILR